MHYPPDFHPLDALSECIAKAAFLADTVSFIAEDPKYDLSPKGLYGLGLYLSELERSIEFVKKKLEEKEA
ncbi:MAG: hypothetical protein A2Y38_16770 [Spirochaetes bacterium GWB1_59_5]|nr:MAG: hypothetical protein A2Y38_16770 [Spirochaetes bacterium GWB1_59_5]